MIALADSTGCVAEGNRNREAIAHSRPGMMRPCARRYRQQRGPVYIASVAATRLDDVATQTYRAAPDDIARLGFAVAHAIDQQAPQLRG